jgi:hypothetical protein
MKKPGFEIIAQNTVPLKKVEGGWWSPTTSHGPLITV